MPCVREMNEHLARMKRDGLEGLRLFVQRSTDISEDDMAAAFLTMEAARVAVPYSMNVPF